MEGIVGAKLLHGSSEVETSKALQGGVVALYFSAHWCPPCQGYTPQLKKVYERAKREGKLFDVIFVSSDRDEASFRQYFASMPWHAVPFSDRAKEQALKMIYQVRGIPSVVLLDGATGSLVDANGRGKVMEPGFVASLPTTQDLALAKLPSPEGPVPVTIYHHGREYEIECEPDEGYEMLRMQIFSVTDIPAEQQRLFGLGQAKGVLNEQVPLPRALVRAMAAQKNTGYKVAGVPKEARKASSNEFPEEQWHAAGGVLTSDPGWGWVHKSKDDNPWYQMDLQEVRKVAGVVLRAGADHVAWVKKFRVCTATTEEGPWDAVDAGREFSGLSGLMLPEVRAIFESPVETRFVRIECLPGGLDRRSLRADVLLADDKDQDKPPTIVVLGNFSADDPFENMEAAQDNAQTKMIEEQHLAMLQAKLSNAQPRLQNQVNSLQGVQRYESRALQKQALAEIPVLGIDESARSSSESYELAFMRGLLRWYKHDFFSWCNAPKCEHCSSGNTKTVGATQPTREEQYFLAGNVEVAQCNLCGLQTRFPRYNDPGKLLETRTGRCGEWANCFTLLCRALGYEARHVHDWTDHVWTEIFSDSLKRWVHADSCEAALDAPLMYEKGWGKKLTYVIAFARDHVIDVSRRYTQKFDDLLPRRTEFSEQELQRVLGAISEFSTDRSLVQVPEATASQRRAALERRAKEEQDQLLGRSQEAKEVKAEEQVGRTSGDAEWRSQRGELGATAAAKEKALELSETGLEGSSAPSSAAKAEPEKAPASRDPQAAAKQRFAELVASGLSPNEAALQVIQDLRLCSTRGLGTAGTD
eukprot:TRINITY_DN26061_c0_g1_i3.p1 TRINITY_DN26061_c0_g1~~TRINITY_DN26061_c0_g1_i3.p1  ORF type:complete len:838 (-),score=160.87 TRINITY_DN26061_c0_g1_i3:125-2563(-)